LQIQEAQEAQQHLSPKGKGKVEEQAENQEAGRKPESFDRESKASQSKSKKKLTSMARRFTPGKSMTSALLPHWLRKKEDKSLIFAGRESVVLMPPQVRNLSIVSQNEVTILFADIVGFTALSSTVSAKELVWFFAPSQSIQHYPQPLLVIGRLTK